MTAKEFLDQAYMLDQRIKTKMEQVETLNELATKCSATITGMPHSPSPSPSKMADAICKIVDLQEEIGNDMNRLVDIKKEIVGVIKAVNNTSYQVLLEKRYLCGETWEEISVDMNYNTRWTKRLHGRALNAVQSVLDQKSSQIISRKK